MLLEDDDKIVTAFAEYSSGPGWHNAPLWLVVMGRNLKCRLECVQPEDQSEEIRTLFAVSNAAHISMSNAARRLLKMR